MQNKLPIIIVRSSYSRFGGAETLTLDLIRALLKLTDQKIVLLTQPKQNWPISHPRLTIQEIGIQRGHRLWVAWAFKRSVAKFLNTHNVSIVLSVDRIEQYTHLHASGGSHRTFLDIHNQQSTLFQRLFRKLSIYHAFILKLERKGVTNPRLVKILCCSKMVADELHSIYSVPRQKLQVCPIPIDWKDIGKSFDERVRIKHELIKMYRIDPESQRLLFLGSGFERKGLDIAIQGLREMSQGYHLMVVGSGNTTAFKQMADQLGLGERVHFLGPQPQGWRFAAMCKALVLPSKYEPFGIAPAEVQAMGLPVLVSNRTGYSEIIEDGKSGIVLDLDAKPSKIKDSFLRLEHLIKQPLLSAEEIRNSVQHLDHSSVLKTVIQDFLGIPINS